MNKKNLQRIVILMFGLAFIGSTGAVVLAGLFDNRNTASNTVSNSQTPEEQIQARVRGYEKVLEREPENFTALNGLAELYLQTGNTEKAIPVIEQLAQLQPERQEYQNILEVLKQQTK